MGGPELAVDNDSPEPQRTESRNGSNGNGGVTRYRLDQIERRLGRVEKEVKKLSEVAARIDEKLNGVATKTYVLWIFGGTAATLVVSIVGHLVVRSISGN